jgi:ubiquinone/menaquinone biosynthesis C-methylase UbiE
MEERGVTTVRNDASNIKNRELQYASQLRSILQSVPKKTPNQVFGAMSDEVWFWLNTEGYRKSAAVREFLPGMPEERVQLQANGSSGDMVLRAALDIYMLFKRIFEENVGKFSACKNVLDFGCGWGRVIRFFLKDIEPKKLWGIDIYDKVIDICKETNEWCNFCLVNPFPPTSFSDDMFDLVFSFSVFSHLSEDAHQKWLVEFSRILRPGGLLIATTRERDFITRCRDSRSEKNPNSWTTHLATIFVDTERWLADYDSGRFCWETAPIYGETSYYCGEACIPRDYVLNHWTKHFKLIDYSDDRKICLQNVIVMKK